MPSSVGGVAVVKRYPAPLFGLRPVRMVERDERELAGVREPAMAPAAPATAGSGRPAVPSWPTTVLTLPSRGTKG